MKRADSQEPEIERIPEEVRDLPEEWEGQREQFEKLHRKTYKSVGEALRYARRVAPGTVMGPSPRDEESED